MRTYSVRVSGPLERQKLTRRRGGVEFGAEAKLVSALEDGEENAESVPGATLVTGEQLDAIVADEHLRKSEVKAPAAVAEEAEPEPEEDDGEEAEEPEGEAPAGSQAARPRRPRRAKR